MKIRKLELVGFKSFVDKTVVNFDHDITGIVGPNGCGKSNVVDAIKWVMGEQSASRLRGKSMDDVIFNGSENRGPAGFAEVSLTFDNTDGFAPPEYSEYAEISVSRRLDRSGRSDYFINRTPVRLMDITNLFLGTGVGRRAYSIIEQGRIGYIVSSKPADRRSMIEEAAGITKFKVRKRAAERKMEQTRQNLLRVGDILRELERNLASLKRQAQKAERYKRYRDEVRDLELHVAAFRYLELFNETRVIGESLHLTSAKEEGARIALQFREAELEVARTQVEQLGKTVEKANTKAYESDNAVRVYEGKIQQLRQRLQSLRDRESVAERELSELVEQRQTLSAERNALSEALRELENAHVEAAALFEKEQEELGRRRNTAEEAERAVGNARGRVADAEKRVARAEAVLTSFERRRQEGRERLEKLKSQKDELNRRLEELEEEKGALAVRLNVLRSGKEQTASQKQKIETELQELRAEIRKSDTQLEILRGEAAEKRSRLASLREVQQRFEGVGAGVRALMTQYNSESENGLVGLVADRLQSPPELDAALAGALGSRLQQVVVENIEQGKDAIEFLTENEAGRAALLPRRPRRVVGVHVELPYDEGIVGRLVDLVYATTPNDEALRRHLLQDIVVVRDMETALKLHRQGTQAALVTLAGECVNPDGSLHGGAGEESGAHLLELKREIRQLETIVGGLDDDLSQAVTRHSELRRGIAQRQAAIDAARSAAHDAEIAIVKAEKDLRRAESEGNNTKRTSERVEEELASLGQALEEASGEEQEALGEIEAAKASGERAREELNAAEAVLLERKQSVEEQSAKVTEVRVRHAQARERLESDRSALERLSRSIDELDQREQRLKGDVAEGAKEQGAICAHWIRTREELGTAISDATRAHQELEQARVVYEEERRSLSSAEVELKQQRSRLEEISGEANRLALRDRELAMELSHLIEQIEERHRVDIRNVLTEFHARELPDEQIRQRVKELLRLIERMGAINLTAIEEYDEKSERYETLKAQDRDLQEALSKLEKAIREMNRESRRLFKEAFVAVNERFKLIYPQLFRGGKAELRLSDPSDILESGVEIIAQPPGKKLGSLELMSGGEKALTAVALIFAIFQYKPSPFCLLDEVDAPLDEANINRFAQAIRQMTGRSQFIVITHSKRTMEFTDVLYGVTMEQPGISKLVSVELRNEAKEMSPAEETTAAVA